MQHEEFGNWAGYIARWSQSYRESLPDKPVFPNPKPGSILDRIPHAPPEQGETMQSILADFESTIAPGLTHWNHPRFFAYFPSNQSQASALADMLLAATSPQCMLWQTSPSATELETRMIYWLRDAFGLGDGFSGILQDTASSSTLCATLAMRETALDWQGNERGLAQLPTVRTYASEHGHFSIDKASFIAGIGKENHIKIPSRTDGSMDPDALRRQIKADQQAGLLPAGLILSVASTSVGECDDLEACISVAQQFGLYVHVDMAWSGTAMICPEFRYMMAGVEKADSLVINLHKWFGVGFECSAHFVKSPAIMQKTLGNQANYLAQLEEVGVTNFSDMAITLGRRFRALKVWFTIRHYGLDGVRTMVRQHVLWAKEMAGWIKQEKNFELTTKPVLSLFSFRYAPQGADDLDRLNKRLLDMINADGTAFLSHTMHQNRYVIRFQIGTTHATLEDVKLTWQTIKRLAGDLC